MKIKQNLNIYENNSYLVKENFTPLKAINELEIIKV